MKKIGRLASSILLLILITAFYSCNKSTGGTTYNNNPGNNNPGNNNPGGNSPNSVSISGSAFVASSISVKEGTTVTWTNNDTDVHTVTADDNSFKSGDLIKGGTYSHLFDKSGTFNYHCHHHLGMKGSVTVTY